MAYFANKHRQQKKISISTPKDICMLLWVAEQKGFLADQKLDVYFDLVPYSRAALDKLINGQVDCAILVETNVAYAGYLKPKIPIKCIASVETRMADGILMRDAKDMKPEDMEGKRVGFTPRTTSHSFLVKFMEHYGIDFRSLKLRPINPPDMGNALISGEVDAISSWHPYTYNTIYAMNELGLSFSHFKNTGFYLKDKYCKSTG